MDIGYTMSQNVSNFDCYIFQDIDLLVEDDRFIHACVENHPVHMSAFHSKDLYRYK